MLAVPCLGCCYAAANTQHLRLLSLLSYSGRWNCKPGDLCFPPLMAVHLTGTPLCYTSETCLSRDFPPEKLWLVIQREREFYWACSLSIPFM